MTNLPLGSDNAGGEDLSRHPEEDSPASTPSTELLPCRGLILAHDNRGRYFREKDYHRWAAYCARVHQCPKMDLLAWGRIPRGLVSTLCYAREFDGLVSLRTDGAAPPDGLDVVAGEGLGDVFLCPEDPEDPMCAQWLEACSNLHLPVRLQLMMPRGGRSCAERLAPFWLDKGVRAVSVVLEDPFQQTLPCESPDEGREIIAFCEVLAERLPGPGVELNVVGMPPGLFSAARPYVVSARSFEYGHQNYDAQARLFAERLYSMSPVVARSLLLLALKRHTVAFNLTDQWLTERLYIHSTPLHNAVLYAGKCWRARRATSLVRATHDVSGDLFPSARRPLPGKEEEEHALRLLNLGADSLAADHDVVTMLEAPRPRYYDRLDEDRLKQAALWQELAREAWECERTVKPLRTCNEKEWGTHDAFVIPEYGATAWLTSLSGKRISTEIDVVNPPFMVSVTVGGGIAELAGFQLTPSCKIVCPMVETRHTLTLYVREDGRYVLLRDNVPVEPATIPGEYPAPRRVPCVCRLHFIAYDIEERISFSPLRLWKDVQPEPGPVAPPVYSVVVFCTRFARRLSIALQCLAHQSNFDLSKLEVIVGYVPGLDATEDVLDSLRLTHPELRVIHATFPRQNLRSKGFVLNQCMRMASGSRILLLDADTLLPPTLFAMLERVVGEHSFIFPKGRAMLGPELTAKLLQGDVRPWECWEALVASADEVRENEALGVPIGYFQCFGRECLEKVRYPEYEHFQGADYEFALGLRNYYGKEYRLDFPVLHLDHAGSQWLGAERHF